MTDKDLIAEAEKYAEAPWTNLDLINARAWLKVLIMENRRLADALELAQVPDGWRVTRYDHLAGAIECDEIGWHVGRYVSDQVYIAWDVKTWPTARDAMAALEKDNAKISQ